MDEITMAHKLFNTALLMGGGFLFFYALLWCAYGAGVPKPFDAPVRTLNGLMVRRSAAPVKLPSSATAWNERRRVKCIGKSYLIYRK